jgi:H+/Cl- antiporter ClcA
VSAQDAARDAAEARTREIVGLLGRASAVAVVVGTVLEVVVARHSHDWWPGFALVAAGTVAALGCLVHCFTRAHERGRGYAFAALILGLIVGLLTGWNSLLEPCGKTSRSLCTKSAGVVHVTAAGH